MTPTLVPVLRTIEAGDLQIGLVAIESYDGACCLTGMLTGGGHEEAFALRARATDGAGRTYEGHGGGGGGTETWARWEQRFPEPFATSAGTIVIEVEIGDRSASASIELPTPGAPWHADVARCELATSTRWPPHLGTPDVDEWRPDDARSVWRALPSCASWTTGHLLPDEIVALRATAPDVAGGDLTFLGIERWGDVCELHAFWDGPDTRYYSPVFAHYLQLDINGDTATAVGGSGGHVSRGFETKHSFIAQAIPERFALRRPAIDGGPPLVEIDVSRTRNGGP
jgi:hypothetical protein